MDAGRPQAAAADAGPARDSSTPTSPPLYDAPQAQEQSTPSRDIRWREGPRQRRSRTLDISVASPNMREQLFRGDTRNPSTMDTSSQADVSSQERVRAQMYQDQPRSPRQQLDDLLASESLTYLSQTAPQEQHSGQNQARSVSSPLTPASGRGGSPPSSPLSAPFPAGLPSHRQLYSIPRTSSLDSTISTISSQASQSQSSTPETIPTKPADLAAMIASAGSPEAVILHLLKEKQSAAAQNSQLWKLMNKQRTLIVGLNKDLERALKDRDRYRKRLKEIAEKPPPIPSVPSDSALETRSGGPVNAKPQSHNAPGQHVGEIISSGLRRSESDLKDEEQEESQEPLLNLPVAAEPVVPDQKVDPKQPAGQTQISLPTSAATPETGTVAPAQDDDHHSSRDILAPEEEHKQDLVRAETDVPLSPSKENERNSQKSEPGRPPARKAPPAPLDLTQNNRASPHLQYFGPDDHSDSDYDDVLEVDEIPAFERGRRKTREEDDRDREIAALKEQQHRSRSKKDKSSKNIVGLSGEPQIQAYAPAEQTELPKQPSATSSRHMISVSPPDAETGVTEGSDSLTAVLKNTVLERTPNLARRVISPLPMSPGLPSSPRPVDRPLNSPLPRMPRDGTNLQPMSSSTPPFAGLPSSPRALKDQSFLRTSMAVASPGIPPTNLHPLAQTAATSEYLSEPAATSEIQDRQSNAHSVDHVSTERSLKSPKYPDLLLGPRSLSDVSVRVSSSRLRSSRQSSLGSLSKSPDEDAVFILGVHVRSNNTELWRIEKALISLPQLDRQLRQSCNLNVKIPDRSLFTGHAPARVDARRVALDDYFEAMLDTPMDEKAALIVCGFLSTDVLESRAADISGGTASAPVCATPQLGGRYRKEGYLTKRGKNFGGWKARFFSLDGPLLRYYETPGGPHLGTIKLQNAQIGKQAAQQSNSSPSRGNDGVDNQYRHAFLVLEPKKKDANSFVKHVLCAENDKERDEWVEALVQYVDYDSSEELEQGSVQDTIPDKPVSQAKKRLLGTSKKESRATGSPHSEEFGALQGVSYDSTVAGEAPVRGKNGDLDIPSSPSPSSTHASSQSIPTLPPSASSRQISAPSNATVIQDAEAWGNRALPLPAKEKEHRKRSIWGFRGRSSSDLATQNGSGAGFSDNGSNVERTAPIRPVFGAPLAEAVEYCSPIGVESDLPAVVYRCIEYLDAKNAASEEGIFRLSGSNVVTKSLRDRFNVEGDIDFLGDGQYFDLHAVASLLKLYLRELPSTVLTRELHLDFLKVLDIDNKTKRVQAYSALVRRLPQENRSLLTALSSFLISIVNNADVNKMGLRNVCIVFSPTLNIPAPVISMFLTEFDSIFLNDRPEDSPSSTDFTASAPSPVTPDDIRSPRRQMFSDLPTPSYGQTSFQRENGQYQPSLDAIDSGGETGFIPFNQTYRPPIAGGGSYPNANGSLTIAGPEYSSLNGAVASSKESDRRRRRESSIMLTNPERKPSGSNLRETSAVLLEESSFG